MDVPWIDKKVNKCPWQLNITPAIGGWF